TFSRITGIGAYRAENLVTNDDIAGPINSSDEWIRQRTGIITRRRASEDGGVLDMCEEAALEAVASAGPKPEHTGRVLISTVTVRRCPPSAAAARPERLGAGPVPAGDGGAACAGYCYGIPRGDALVRAGTMDNVLAIGAEKLSDIIDPEDR